MTDNTILSAQRQVIDEALNTDYGSGIDGAAAIICHTHDAMASAIAQAGRDDTSVMALATDIASHALNAVVEGVNDNVAVLTEAMRNAPDRRQYIDRMLSVLANARNILTYLGHLPVSDEFYAARLKPQSDRLDRLIDRAGDIPANIDVDRPPVTLPTSEPPAPKAAKQPARRRTLLWLSAAIITAICAVWGFDYYREYACISALRTAYAEEWAIAYLSDGNNTYFRDEALSMYLDHAADGLSAYDGMAQTSPLVRMYQLASSPTLRPAERAAVSATVNEAADSLYRLAVALDDLESWHRYQDLVPADFYRDSSDRIDSIDAVIWSDEPTAWAAANAAADRGAYQRYLALYPKGSHADDADRRLVDYEVNDYRNRSGASPIDSISHIASYSKGSSSVYILNQSEYPIQFLFSGPTSKRMHIPAGQTSDIVLADGTYRVLVLIDNPRSDRFSFTQTFRSGVYSSSISMGRGDD